MPILQWELPVGAGQLPVFQVVLLVATATDCYLWLVVDLADEGAVQFCFCC